MLEALLHAQLAFGPHGTLLPSQYEDILQISKQIHLEERTPQHKLKPPAGPAKGACAGTAVKPLRLKQTNKKQLAWKGKSQLFVVREDRQ